VPPDFLAAIFGSTSEGTEREKRGSRGWGKVEGREGEKRGGKEGVEGMRRKRSSLEVTVRKGRRDPTKVKLRCC